MKTTTTLSRNSANVSRLAICAALLSGTAIVAPAYAQDTQTAAADVVDTGEIIVTARRKDENILKVPISIRAFDATDITARGINNLQDIAQFVPGANVVGQATQGGRADRSFVGIVLRGMVPSTAAAQTTSIFIDGAPVTSATAMQTLNNPARVEVIKGPQSALFGRQTFAGALNIVTKDPTDDVSGSVSVMAGTRTNYDVSVEFSAPIIKDILSVRASGRAFGKHGSYQNASIRDQTLGDQSTKTGSLALKFTPTENLTVKAFGMFTELKDGPSAQGLISAYEVKDASGKIVIADQSNCNLKGSSGVTTRYMCGIAPALSALTPSANTANDSVITDFLANPTGRVVSPEDGPSGYGLVNHYRHAHLNIAYDIGDTGVTLQSLSSYNQERKSEVADLDNFNGRGFPQTPSATNSGFFNFPFLVEAASHDFSQELRASLENGGPLHLTGGASYLNAKNQTASGSPNIVGARFAGVQRTKTFGVFGSVSYDITDAFTLNFDGRYQVDKVSAFAGQGGVTATSNAFVPIGVYPEGSLLIEKTYKNFLPRVIGQYNFDSGMVYASYSKGVNPGVFNTSFIVASPAVVAAAQALGYQIAVQPEKITNYEIGMKGRLFDNKVRYDTAVFRANWTDQIQSQSQFVNVNGLPQQVVASTNAGKVRITGVEASVSADLAHGLELDLAGAFIDSKIQVAANSAVTLLTGVTDFSGKQNPFTSKWSGTAALQYTTAIKEDLDAYGRVDLSYKTGVYSNVANIVRTPDMTQVNVRLGVRNKGFSVEGFVTNVFNNRAYFSIADTGLTLPNRTFAVSSALIAQLRELRTFGVRGTINF